MEETNLPIEANAENVFANSLMDQTENTAENIFASAEVLSIANMQEEPVNDKTVQVAAMADVDDDAMPDGQVGSAIYLQQQIAKTRARIEGNEEDRIRKEAAFKRALRMTTAINQNPVPMMDPKTGAQIMQSVNVHFDEQYRKNMRLALEREALEKAQRLAIAGDTTQASLILDRYTPGKMNVADVWDDYNVTNIALMQQLEKARQREDKEGWGGAIWTGLWNLVQPSSFSYLGNVDEGVGRYDPSFLRFFMPGTELRAQQSAFWSLPAEQRLEYIDKLGANIQNNATTMWVTDPDKEVELWEGFVNPTGEDQASSMNKWNAFELGSFVAPQIGIVPYRALGKALSLPGQLVAAGARKEAAAAVSNAYDTIIREGVAEAEKKTGINIDDVEDQIMPSIINPLGAHTAEDVFISLNGQVSDNLAEAQEIIKKMGLVQTERMTDIGEIQAAYDDAAKSVSERFGGATVLDIKPVTTELHDGTVVRAIDVVMTKPGGGLMGSLTEARGFADNFGYSEAGITHLGPEPEKVFVDLTDYTMTGYHGTKNGETFTSFDDWQNYAGASTGAKSAKAGVFFASPPGSYKGWTKLQWEQHADILEQEIKPAIEDIKARLVSAHNTIQHGDELLPSDRELLQEAWDKLKETKDLAGGSAEKDLFHWYSNIDVFINTFKGRSAPFSKMRSVYADVMYQLDDEIKLGRNFDASNAVNLAWSYARMAKNKSDEYLNQFYGFVKKEATNNAENIAVEKYGATGNWNDNWVKYIDKPELSRIFFTSDNIVDDLVNEFGEEVQALGDFVDPYNWLKSETENWVDKLRNAYNEKFPAGSSELDSSVYQRVENFLTNKANPENVDSSVNHFNQGASIIPVKIKPDNLKVIVDERGYDDFGYTDEMNKAKAEGYDGIVFKNARDPGNEDQNLPVNGKYDVVAIWNTENTVIPSISPYKVIQDSSGGFAVEVRHNIPDTAFLSNPLSPPPQGFLAKFWKTTSQTSDKTVFQKAVMADSKFARLQQIIDKDLNAAFRKVSTKERAWLNQVLAKGQQEQTWFSDDQFAQLVERAMGKPPSENMTKAYHQYRLNNDIEWLMRNDGLYREKLIRKYESFQFEDIRGTKVDMDGVILSGEKPPQGRIWVASVGETLDNLTSSLDDFLADHKLIRLEKSVDFEGIEVNHVLVQNNELSIQPLRRQQLPYTAGGHRLYSDKIFIKQAIKGVHPDTGQEFWKEPGTWATAANIKEARAYAQIMNAAREAVAKGKDAVYLDNVVFAGKGGPAEKGFAYPSGEEFIKAIEEGRISKDEVFEAVYDREMPSAYRNSGVDVSRFMNEEDMTGLPGYYRQLGQMYYSKKGDALRSVKGGLAPVVDPFETMSRALTNVARMSSFADFKTNAVERWVKTYLNNLDTKMLSDETNASVYQLFVNANLRNDTPPALKQQILGQREAIKRILGFQSEFERGYRQWVRHMSEWVIGDSDSALRKKISEGLLWAEDKNPVGFLRGLAFDMKLGLFNWGQFFIQTSTMASAFALNPTHGKYGMASAIPVWSYFLSKGNENVLETLAKRGVHKLAGFADEETFKRYVRQAHESGFFNLGDTHAMVNDFGYASTFGSLGEKTHNIREMGRVFFYNAEVFNRLVAHRIGFGEAVEKFGIDAMDSFEFREFVMGRAENYSLNMSGVSKAWWQQGILSVPTQFWAYNVRMLEALVGNNFTMAQKLRLAGMQLAMAGTAGLPILPAVADYVKSQTGETPDISTLLGTLDRGLADKIIYELTGADVKAGEKWGTGTWSGDLVRDLFGMSEYNEKSFSDIALGATGSILWTTLAPVVELTKYYMAHESGSEQIDMSNELWMAMFKNISTFGNTAKALTAYNYGLYKSNKGFVLADGLPKEDAVWLAMGLRPGEVDVLEVKQAYNRNRTNTVRELAQPITAWRQEAFANPSIMAENAQKVNAYVQMLPMDVKRDVLRQAHKQTDPSLYASVVERYEKNKHKEEIAHLIEGNQQ